MSDRTVPVTAEGTLIFQIRLHLDPFMIHELVQIPSGDANSFQELTENGHFGSCVDFFQFHVFSFLPFPVFFLHLSGRGKKQGGTAKGTKRRRKGGRASAPSRKSVGKVLKSAGTTTNSARASQCLGCGRRGPHGCRRGSNGPLVKAIDWSALLGVL